MREVVRIIGVTIFVLLVIAALVLSDSPESDSSKDITKNVEDAVYGTNQTGDDKITNLLREVVSIVRERHTTDLSNNNALDQSDIYEASSYETKTDLQRIITLLEQSINELKQTENIVQESYQQIEQMIRENKDLTETERVEALKIFRERITNTESIAVRKERADALVDLYEVSLDYYKFLLREFDDYVIQSNESSERTIAFYSEENRKIANGYLAEISLKSEIFLKADNAQKEYMQSRFSEERVNMNVDDLYNLFY